MKQATDWIGKKYCQKCSLIGWQWCKCEPPKPTVELSIPRSATIDDASYWMKRAAALCPGSDVIPKFVKFV